MESAKLVITIGDGPEIISLPDEEGEEIYVAQDLSKKSYDGEMRARGVDVDPVIQSNELHGADRWKVPLLGNRRTQTPTYSSVYQEYSTVEKQSPLVLYGRKYGQNLPSASAEEPQCYDLSAMYALKLSSGAYKNINFAVRIRTPPFLHLIIRETLQAKAMGLEIVNKFVPPHSLEEIRVMVINPTEKEIAIKKGDLIGQVYPVRHVNTDMIFRGFYAGPVMNTTQDELNMSRKTVGKRSLLRAVRMSLREERELHLLRMAGIGPKAEQRPKYIPQDLWPLPCPFFTRYVALPGDKHKVHEVCADMAAMSGEVENAKLPHVSALKVMARLDAKRRKGI